MPKILLEYSASFEEILFWLLDPLLAWALKNGTFLIHKSYMAIVSGFLKLLNTWVSVYEDQEVKIPKEIEEILVNVAFFCAVWSIGGAIE